MLPSVTGFPPSDTTETTPFASIGGDERCTRCGERHEQHHPLGYCVTQARGKHGVLVTPGQKPDRFRLEQSVVRFAPVYTPRP